MFEKTQRVKELAGYLSDAMDRGSESKTWAQRAAELLPNDFDVLQDYAVNFFAAERFDIEADWAEAAAAWQAARAQARSTNEEFFTWLNEGRVRQRMGKTEEARICFEAALAIRPDSAVVKDRIAELTADGE